MKKLLLASVFAIASFSSIARADSCADYNACFLEEGNKLDENGAPQCGHKPPKCEINLDGAAAERDRIGNVEPDEVPHPGDRQSPPAHVTVAPPYQGPPPIGWVYAPYTQCGNPPQCSMGVVSVDASGLNVRTVPHGPPVMALVNGTPLYPLQRQGNWLLAAPACDLTPTWAWSWNAGVPLNRCWVYF